MKNYLKWGALSSLYMSLAYIFGMVGFLAVVNVSEESDVTKKLSLIASNQAFLSTLYLFVYLVFGVALVTLSLALFNLLKNKASILIQTATVVGIIWACILIGSGLMYMFGMDTVVNLQNTNPAQAGTVWLAIESISEASGIEFLGGVWMLLVSLVALQVGKLKKPLNYFGIALGVAGVLSALPGLRDVGMVFGLGQIFWFIWLGIVMLKTTNVEPKQV